LIRYGFSVAVCLARRCANCDSAAMIRALLLRRGECRHFSQGMTILAAGGDGPAGRGHAELRRPLAAEGICPSLWLRQDTAILPQSSDGRTTWPCRDNAPV
jgi:hypothetical protein